MRITPMFFLHSSISLMAIVQLQHKVIFNDNMALRRSNKRDQAPLLLPGVCFLRRHLSSSLVSPPFTQARNRAEKDRALRISSLERVP